MPLLFSHRDWRSDRVAIGQRQDGKRQCRTLLRTFVMQLAKSLQPLHRANVDKQKPASFVVNNRLAHLCHGHRLSIWLTAAINGHHVARTRVLISCFLASSAYDFRTF